MNSKVITVPKFPIGIMNIITINKIGSYSVIPLITLEFWIIDKFENHAGWYEIVFLKDPKEIELSQRLINCL